MKLQPELKQTANKQTNGRYHVHHLLTLQKAGNEAHPQEENLSQTYKNVLVYLHLYVNNDNGI